MASHADDERNILLQEAKDQPDEDLPRLVLADWLIDQDDPRGEFIHLQLQLHRLPADDLARDVLRRRERALLRLHGLDWVGPFVDHISAWHFHRGFIQLEARADRLLDDALDRIEYSPACLWVDELHLHDARSHHLRRLGHSPMLHHLVVLILEDNRLSDEALDHLLRSPNLGGLRTLRLAGNRLTARGATSLANCPDLTRLRHLDLSGNRLGYPGAIALAGSPWLANLHRLAVSRNAVGDEGLDHLRARFGDRLQIVRRRLDGAEE